MFTTGAETRITLASVKQGYFDYVTVQQTSYNWKVIWSSSSTLDIAARHDACKTEYL